MLIFLFRSSFHGICLCVKFGQWLAVYFFFGPSIDIEYTVVLSTEYTIIHVSLQLLVLVYFRKSLHSRSYGILNGTPALI